MLEETRRTMERMRPYSPTYRTTYGQIFEGRCEDILAAPPVIRLKGKTHLIFTSPPFPLNRKKKYGNLQGEEYVAWLSSLAPLLRDYLAPKGSIVIELGNAWVPGKPDDVDVANKSTPRVFGGWKSPSVRGVYLLQSRAITFTGRMGYGQKRTRKRCIYKGMMDVP